MSAAEESNDELLRLYSAVDVARKWAGREPTNPASQRALANVLNGIGDVLEQRHEPVKALNFYGEALKIRRSLANADRGKFLLRIDLSFSYERMGRALSSLGDFHAALVSSKKCLRIARKLASDDPGNPVWRCNLADAHAKVGSAAILADQMRTGRRHLCAAAEMSRHLEASGLLDHEDVLAFDRLKRSLDQLLSPMSMNGERAWPCRTLDWARRRIVGRRRNTG